MAQRSGRVVVTGFGPFGEHTTNSSEQVVRLLQLEMQRRPGLTALVLPVSFREVEERVADLYKDAPDVVLHLGLAAGTRQMRFEQVALNLDHSGATDNLSEARWRSVIEPNAPVAYRSSLPLEAMAAVAERRGLEVDYSRDCGGFVCNHLFYRSRHVAAQAPSPAACGFVHLPACTAEDVRIVQVAQVILCWCEELFGLGRY